jgi:alpha-glucosidase
LPNTAELDKWYGGPEKNELQLPMDMLLGFSNKLDATAFRKYIEDAETELHGSQPLFVFDNHDNIRSIDRYGDGEHNPQIARLLASVLLTTRATALMYYGEELGMKTSTPTRREDVKDPIGITGWPKEKGRDGERTPMQWDSSNRQAGFSATPHTWLPVANDYATVNVASEEKDTDSLLHWYEQLIRMRRDNPALRNGGLEMLDATNSNVLSYVRTAPPGSRPVVVVLNMSSSSQTVSLRVPGQSGDTQKATSLLKSKDMPDPASLSHVELAPYGVYIGEVQ